MEQPWIKITFSTPDNEVNATEKALRETLQTAASEAFEQYMQKSRLQNLLGIELFPCDEGCEHCVEEAAEDAERAKPLLNAVQTMKDLASGRLTKKQQVWEAMCRAASQYRAFLASLGVENPA
jgi:hypothetical protein